jgi:hypothetical protein
MALAMRKERKRRIEPFLADGYVAAMFEKV